jgi:thiol-disulfide isomerase/thioredoxin
MLHALIILVTVFLVSAAYAQRALEATAAQQTVAPIDTPHYTTTASGVRYSWVPGAGRLPRPGDTIQYRVVVRLPDGTIQEALSSPPNGGFSEIRVGTPSRWFKGIDEILDLVATNGRTGDRITVIVPPALGVPEAVAKRQNLPYDMTLNCQVEIVGIKAHRIADVMFKVIEEQGLEAAKAYFNKLKAEGFPEVHVSQNSLGYLGRGYLFRCNDFQKAFAVFQWNLELYPQTPSCHADLARAFMLLGERDKMIAHLERELALRLETDGARAAVAKKLEELYTSPDKPTQQEQVMELLSSAGRFGGLFAKQPINIIYLRQRFEHYLLTATEEDSNALSRMAKLFLTLVDAEGTLPRDEIHRQFAQSPLAAVREAAEEWGGKTSTAIGKPFNLAFTAADGRLVDVAKLKGKVILIDFWATWCAPCVEEIPNVVSVYEKYHGQGFEVIGVSLDGKEVNAEALVKYAVQHRMPWPQHYDGGRFKNQFAAKFGVDSIPAMFLVDKEGRIASRSARGSELEKEVKRLLGL